MKKMFLFALNFLLMGFIMQACISCYRMPTDEDFSVVPTTNNPAVTCERPNTSLMPKTSY